MAHVSMTLRQVSILVDRVAAWFAEWRRVFREIRLQAKLTRELEGVDDHLLRDIGLTWTGRRFKRSGCDDCAGR
jgi:uncharacterized protein YjiS (DUF1127 family)